MQLNPHLLKTLNVPCSYVESSIDSTRHPVVLLLVVEFSILGKSFPMRFIVLSEDSALQLGVISGPHLLDVMSVEFADDRVSIGDFE